MEATGSGGTQGESDGGTDPTGPTGGSTSVTTSASNTTTPDTSASASTTEPATDEGSIDDTGGGDGATGTDDTSASAGESTSDGGSTGGGCMPTPEACDGIDNDCDMVIDEGSTANATCNGCSFLLAADGASYFAYCSMGVTWAAARTACTAFGAGVDLAIIDVDADQVALIGLVAGDTWIGMDDQTEEGHWVWVDGSDALVGGAPVGYDGWAPTQPAGGNAENCGELDPLQPGWADSPCGELQAYLCRHPA